MQPPIEATHLGKQSTYPDKYDPSLLVAVPRVDNRRQYGLYDGDLPFTGIDVWHCYEAGFLTNNGVPVAGVLKLTYSCDSAAIVESKSLKLYFNSFNMEKLGPTANQATDRFVSRVTRDLSALLNTPVTAHFFSTSEPTANEPMVDFDRYTLMDALPELRNIEFTAHTEAPSLLASDITSPKSAQRTLTVCTHLLRSNCKITHQPDWGSAFISIEGLEIPTIASLMQYLVSFRGENHFHEEVCEMVYKRLWDRFAPHMLAVTCVYTRRGGIDICPIRVSHSDLIPVHLANVARLSPRLLRQ